MWIVRVALNRPYTFLVLALLILVLAPIVILRTPTDIFPDINIPVIAVAWQYTGLNPEEMEGRITTVFERVLTTLVDNIEHIESVTINGQSFIKIYLQPNASLDSAKARSRRSSLASALRRFLYCSWVFRVSLNRTSTMSLSTFSEPSSSLCLAHQFRTLTAASNGRL